MILNGIFFFFFSFCVEMKKTSDIKNVTCTLCAVTLCIRLIVSSKLCVCVIRFEIGLCSHIYSPEYEQK